MCDAEMPARFSNSSLPKTMNSRCKMRRTPGPERSSWAASTDASRRMSAGVTPRELPSLRRRPARNAALLDPVPHQACHLGSAEPGHFHQKPAHNPFLSFAQFPILLTLQRGFDQAIGLLAGLGRQADLAVPFHELLHFGQTQPFQILHGDVHLPAACACQWPDGPPRFSGSSCIGNELSFQAHRPLETGLVSGSSCIG